MSNTKVLTSLFVYNMYNSYLEPSNIEIYIYKTPHSMGSSSGNIHDCACSTEENKFSLKTLLKRNSEDNFQFHYTDLLTLKTLISY